MHALKNFKLNRFEFIDRVSLHVIQLTITTVTCCKVKAFSLILYCLKITIFSKVIINCTTCCSDTSKTQFHVALTERGGNEVKLEQLIYVRTYIYPTFHDISKFIHTLLY